MKKSSKSAWQTPQLVSFGTVEKLTQQTNCCQFKQVGPGDGQFLVINGDSTAISCVS